jgi:hypothetical protein
MVPKKGLEPPHPCGYMDLNHARLPIPPLRRQILGGDLKIARQEETEIIFLPGYCQLSNAQSVQTRRAPETKSQIPAFLRNS